MQRELFLNQVKERVKLFDKNAEIMLFGSRARGDYKSTSDWDFLILLQIGVTEELKDKIRDNLFDLELEADEVVSSIIQSKSKWDELTITPLHQIIQKEGLRL